MKPEDKKMLKETLQFVKELEVPATALSVVTDIPVLVDPVSSMGGSPSMPPNTQWPTCKDQQPMVFLAQLNLAEMPPLQSFPEKGILQFFVKDEDVFGLFTEDFQVHYYEDSSALVRRSAPEVQHTPFGHRLHSEGAILKGSSSTGQPTFGCWQVEEYSEKLEDAGANDAVFDALEDAFDKARPSTHYLGGHPSFCQGDVRGDKGRDIVTVLFQMGYQPDENGWEVCWGDAGEAMFLSTDNDLLRQDFSKVLYNWDCG